jgi:hypothetical protein
MKAGSLILTLALCVGAIAAEPKWNVRTELLAVRIPQEAGLKLRPALRESKIDRSRGQQHLRDDLARRGDAGRRADRVVPERSALERQAIYAG